MRTARAIALIVLVSGPVSLTLSGWAQDSWVAKVDKSPILLLSEGGTLSVRNRTDKVVKSYGLGCARSKHGRFLVVHRFRLETTTIPPLGQALMATFDGGPEGRSKCESLTAKLIPLEVTFQDGPTWQLEQVASSKTPTSSSEMK